MSGFFDFLGAVFIVFGVPILGIWLIVYLFQLAQDLPDKYRRASAEEAQKGREREASERKQVELDDLRDVPPYPPATKFSAEVLAAYREGRTKLIHAAYLPQLVKAMEHIYSKDLVVPKQLPSLRDPFAAYDILYRALFKALRDFTDKLPPEYLDAPATNAPLFETCLPEIPIEAFAALAAPLTDPAVRQYIPHWMRWDYRSELYRPTRPDHDSDDTPQERKEKQREYEQEKKEYYKFYNDIMDEQSPIQRALSGSPFYPLAESLLPPPMVRPVLLTDRQRFEHAFIVGPTGSGKTTLMSALIESDLDRVAKGEASVFVMDSQNEFLPSLARLARFAQGGDLHGKLVYLEPDPEFPLSLNIFDMGGAGIEHLSPKDRMVLEQGAEWMVRFFIGALVKSEASPQQDTYLHYLIQALLAIPDATVFTLIDLLTPASKGAVSGYDRYKQHFGKLRPQTQRWLAERLHHPELAVTRNSIRNRVDGIVARGFFHDMFMHPRNKVDLAGELQTAKVILINTNKGLIGPDNCEALGRFFIARLMQATEQRMLIDKERRLPTFCYLDEAADYIADEGQIAELVDKARKQKIALTVAVQREPQIRSANVLDALHGAHIQFRGNVAPQWGLTLRGREPMVVEAKNVNFAELPQMGEREFYLLQAQMRSRYSHRASEDDYVDADYVHVPSRPALPPPDSGSTDWER